ncbi:uncharacterized protein LOC132393877 [Hypanus sabinus]|uniref:uncharacterized protein LOC132393877 n=1 Tax=Hypanus sabinus TaxID=79690 RepID=UPI0028C4029F|nr:uncharacterized protein LOC132393877 [Hypanus sabinus]
MGKKNGNKKSDTTELAAEGSAASGSPTRPCANEAAAGPRSGKAVNIFEILKEIMEVQKEIKQQLRDIKLELTSVNQKIAVAETQIEKVEDRIQNMEQKLSKTIKIIHHQEGKLVDLEGRSRRKNIRTYNIPKRAEGSSKTEFVRKLLQDALDIPSAMKLEVKRAHRTLVPKPTQDRKPCSIIKFLWYSTKAEILRRAWGKKRVFFNDKLIYFDQDYHPPPPAVLQKSKAYSEVKGVLKQK